LKVHVYSRLFEYLLDVYLQGVTVSQQTRQSEDAACKS